ncbi:hypothetical protein JOQ06_030552, partial [Pogonophryne albipinna]
SRGAAAAEGEGEERETLEGMGVMEEWDCKRERKGGLGWVPVVEHDVRGMC